MRMAGTEQLRRGLVPTRPSPPMLVHPPSSHLRTSLTCKTRVDSGSVEAKLDEDGEQESKAQPLDDVQGGPASRRQQVTAQHRTLPSPAHHRHGLRLPSTCTEGT